MIIARDIENDLMAWAKVEDRKPLLVRGARRVGKSFLIREWASKNIGQENYLELNLEEQPKYRELFKRSLDPLDIQREINLMTGFKFSEKSLLFIDEIQACPEALMSLRFFYEKMPKQMVIAAGSLLEFILEEISFPVGRVRSLFMSALSFAEFVQAFKGKDFRDRFDALDFGVQIPELIHEELNKLLKLYFRIGGMPKTVKTYLTSSDISLVALEHAEILQAYLDDIGKYSKKISWDVLQTIFTRLPSFVMLSNLKLSKLGDGLRTEKVRAALRLFEMGQVMNKISSSNAAKPPLESMANPKRVKYAFLDLGLLQFSLGFDWSKYSLNCDLLDVCDGVFAEQFVAQEFIAIAAKHAKASLHYWDRDISGSEAEVDFLVEANGQIIPVEVKNSAQGRLKSLHLYMEEKKSAAGIILCQRNIESRKLENGKVLIWAPLYLAGKVKKVWECQKIAYNLL